ncbi:GxxExxY protein [Pseudoalteromonas distincta]|uniref:GxxExxY protein n=1 Tax=Pseudoalteromonas distincta TaxID=77608 RepID=A0ABT9GBR8_9GAMM|nr:MULTISPECIES: GxxExxY protein [Pseudoalteromonas distincta group]KHM46543.1 GxxExxY protein [Pseudoalteromonas elyakovii]KID34150.1 GxxExxY protein [Pseudoalteromonas distincta]MDP4483089.1 GxxExxY protein [Pseudoalteromonas elyakovii]
MDTDTLTKTVIGCAIEVHRNLGPGLLESSYETCLIYELSKIGLSAKNQVELPIYYKDQYINTGYRLDILLPNKLIIELKVVDKLLPIHSAQLITYMKLAEISTGLLINFNVLKLVDGIKRFNS